MDPVYIFLYFVMYAFSIGAFIQLWDIDDEFTLTAVIMLMVVWPVVWAFYIPYRFASAIFK